MSTIVYSVNGKDVPWSGSEAPTAGELKRLAGSEETDIISVIMPDGSRHQLKDNERIPSGIFTVTSLPPFDYGSPFQSYETQKRCQRLQAEAQLVENALHVSVSYDKTDGTWFHVAALPIPPGWNYPAVDILIDIPHTTPGYPSLKPAWFWVNRSLKTSDSRSIGHFFKQGDASVDDYHWKKGYGKFCIHVNVWKPLSGAQMARGDNLLTYLRIIKQVFHDRKILEK